MEADVDDATKVWGEPKSKDERLLSEREDKNTFLSSSLVKGDALFFPVQGIVS